MRFLINQSVQPNDCPAADQALGLGRLRNNRRGGDDIRIVFNPTQNQETKWHIRSCYEPCMFSNLYYNSCEIHMCGGFHKFIS